MLIPLIVGLTIAVLIGLRFEYLSGLGSLLLLNFFILLHLPGSLITALTFAIITPQKAWQAMHLVPPYNYFAYIADFVFYFCLTYLICFVVARLKRARLLKIVKENNNRGQTNGNANKS